MKATVILYFNQRQWKEKKGTIHKTRTYLVDNLRNAVYQWREQGYLHTTDNLTPFIAVPVWGGSIQDLGKNVEEEL